MVPSSRFALLPGRFGPRGLDGGDHSGGRQEGAGGGVRRVEVTEGSCPLFLSLRMRRVLECAFGLSPSGMCDAPRFQKSLSTVSLPDDAAFAVVALMEHHHIPLAFVAEALADMERNESMRKRSASAGAALVYERLLQLLQLRFRAEGSMPAGVRWEASRRQLPRPLRPAAVGPGRWRALEDVDLAGTAPSAPSVIRATAERVEAAAARRNEAARRPWFGPHLDTTLEQHQIGTWPRSRSVEVGELPIQAKSTDILQMMSAHQVCLLQGETGSGKTTQVPQYLLDSTLSHIDKLDEPMRIVVTQPRRISAISVAKRVCYERGEVCGYGEVGYKIRGLTIAGPRCRLLFCTTGVLLRRIAAEGEGQRFLPQTVTHLIIDEVHERGSETDFLLTLLKDELPNRPRLRVILMSATMDAECLRRYFTTRRGGIPPILNVPGFVHPVQEVYLELIEEQLGVKPQRFASGRACINESEEYDGVPYDLIVQLVTEICRVPSAAWEFASAVGEARLEPQTNGAVLVFLPGAGEINELCTRLRGQPDAHKWWILQLHAGLPIAQQQECFRTDWPEGCSCKVVASTNVAETSVTLPDITAVIDTCRERRIGVERTTNTPLLREQWCAKDSLKQRRGRAGRVRPGVCFRLVTEKAFSSFASTTPPEIQRAPLENVYLQVCASRIHDAAAFLARMPDPPDASQVRFAEVALRDMGALDDVAGDRLTPLGRHLAALPCHPRLGKILVLGCLLCCPGPCLNISSVLSIRSPMLQTHDASKRAAWTRARQELLKAAGCRSDHCAWAAFLTRWHQTHDEHRKQMCEHYGLSYERMHLAGLERQQLCEALTLAQLLPPSFARCECDGRSCTRPDWALVRSAVVGGLYPSILHVERVLTHGTPKQMDARERADQMRFTILQRHLAQKGDLHYPINIHLHPSSMLWGNDEFECPWLGCFMIKHTGRLYAYDVSEAPPYALLLFGDSIEWNEAEEHVRVGGGLVQIRCSGGAVLLPVISAARAALHQLLQRKLDEPSADYTQSRELCAIAKLLSTNGLGFELP